MSRILFLIVILFTTVFLFNSNIYAQQKEIKLAYPDNDVPPWQMGDGDHVFSPPGLSIDIISRAAKELGIKLKISRLPTNRVYNAIKKEEVDGIFIFSFLNERLELGEYPMKNGKIDHDRRVGTISYSFYKRKDSKVNWDGKKLQNISSEIGVNRGYSVINELQKLEIPYEESKGTEILIKKLNSSRITTIVGQSIAVDFYISKLKLTNIIKLDPPLITKDYFLIFGHKFIKENKFLAENFWNQIGKIRDVEIKNKISLYDN